MSEYEEVAFRDSVERGRSISPILGIDERHYDKSLSSSLVKEVEPSIATTSSVERTQTEHSPHEFSPRIEKLRSFFSEKWEDNPGEIEQRAAAGFITWNTSFLFLDLFWAMLIPVLFMTLAVVAARLHRQSVQGMGDWGTHVERAIQLGPSIWPIVFAAIVGRSMRTIARFQAERGTTIGFLEQLVGSTTVLGTLECVYELRSLRLSSIFLVALWALSPLGGQASLRLLGRRVLATTDNVPVRFLNTSVPQIVNFDDIQRNYQAAMVAPENVKSSPRDAWGSLKVPSYSSMRNIHDSSTHPNESAWLDVTSSSNYSSFIGVPITGVPPAGMFELNFTTGYFEFHVSGWEYLSNKTLNYTEVNSLLPNLTFPWQVESNHSNSQDIFVNNSTNTETDWFLDTNSSFLPSPKAPEIPRNMTFGTRSSNPTAVGLIHLNATFVLVDLQCECNNGQCAAKKIRVSDQIYNTFGSHSTSGAIDWYQTPLDDQSVAGKVFTLLPLIDGQADTRTSVNYLQNSAQSESSVTSEVISHQGIDVRIWSSNLENFAERFGVIFNTFWLATIAPWQGGAPPSIESLEGKKPIFASAPATGIVTTSEEVYVCNWGWFILVICASIVTFFCGILNAVVYYQSLAPDILGYVSSLTRDNPYCNVPSGGSLLDGIDRARVLKDVKVRLEDVRPQDDIGHVAFAVSNGDEFSPGRLRWGRLYD